MLILSMFLDTLHAIHESLSCHIGYDIAIFERPQLINAVSVFTGARAPIKSIMNIFKFSVAIIENYVWYETVRPKLVRTCLP